MDLDASRGGSCRHHDVCAAGVERERRPGEIRHGGLAALAMTYPPAMSGARDNPDDATMSFGDHLEELRRRLLFAGAPALPLGIVLFFFSDSFIRFAVLPLRRVLEAKGLPPEIQALSPPEVLLVKLKLSLILAAVLLGPWILWQTWLFVRPGLYAQERRFVNLLIPGSALLTAGGLALLYFLMLPLMLQVLVGVGADLDLGTPTVRLDPRVQAILDRSEPATIAWMASDPSAPEAETLWMLWPSGQLKAAVRDADAGIVILEVPRPPTAAITQQYRLSTYITFVLLLVMGICIAFQMPLVIVLLGWVGLVTPQWLARQRRYALFVCGALSALLTPQDIVSMLVLLIPLYGLYELGILLLRLAPARAVAEGTFFGRSRSDKPGDGAAQPEHSPRPTRSAGSIPRSPGPQVGEGPRSTDSDDAT